VSDSLLGKDFFW